MRLPAAWRRTLRTESLPALGASALCLAAGLACAQEPAWRAAIGPVHLSVASDSDGLSISKPGITGFWRWDSGARWHGLELQQQRYLQADQVREGRSVALIGQSIDAATWQGYGYKLGWSNGPTRAQLVADGFYNGRLGPGMQWGVFGTRDVVESMAGVRDGLSFNLAGASLEAQAAERLALVGAASVTRFSDGQDRRQLRLRGVWDLLPEQGITLQVLGRLQTGEREVAVRRYFNPGRLQEGQAVLGWRRRWEGWQFTARVGAGSQRVDGGSGVPVRTGEILLQSPLRSHGQHLRLRLGYSDTQGLSGPGYIYRSGDVSWVLPL